MSDDRNTALDPIYLRTLLRVNLTTSLSYFGLFILVIAGAPLVFWLYPSLATTHLWSLPLPWLSLGLAGFPILVLMGWRYVLAVEEDEAEFSEMVDAP
jgi:hypothetical protein